MWTLSLKELQTSEYWLLRLAQHQDFSLEIFSLQENHNMPRKSPLINLQPFLDEMGCLRMGSRIREVEFAMPQFAVWTTAFDCIL